MFQAMLELLKRAFFFTGYFATQSYPKPLTAEQEKALLVKMKNGDMSAREKLILHNMRLVAHIVKKYNSFGESEDLLSVGSIGLIKGIETYSLAKGTTLATYLARCIENEILMNIRANKKHKNNVSIGEQLGLDSEGDEYTLMEILSEDEESVYHHAELSILKNKLLVLIKENLSQQEQRVILLRFALVDEIPLTQLETAKKLGISRSYVSRIETRALKKLKDKIQQIT